MQRIHELHSLSQGCGVRSATDVYIRLRLVGTHSYKLHIATVSIQAPTSKLQARARRIASRMHLIANSLALFLAEKQREGGAQVRRIQEAVAFEVFDAARKCLRMKGQPLSA